VKEAKATDIEVLFREGTPIDKALKQAVREAMIRHKKEGNSVVSWQDGKIVRIKPEDIPVSRGPERTS
jgi:hypothetical protein